MAQGSRQVQTQAQQQVQTLSPQQILVVKLLELPTVELEERIHSEILDNPALEEGRETPENGEESTDFEGNEDNNDNSEPNDDISLGDYRTEDDIPDYKLQEHNRSRERVAEEIPFSDAVSFYEILKEQLAMQDLTDEQREIAEYLIGSLDDDGLLRKSIESVMDELAIYRGIYTTENELNKILEIIQDFDPAGIGARNLQECLLIQINRKADSPLKQIELDIIGKCCDEFTRKNKDKIIQKLGITEEQYNEALAELTKLNPRPGSSLGEAMGRNFQQIIPDFIVETFDDGTITLNLNNRNVPELRLSREFTELLDEHTRNKENQSKESKDALMFLKQKVDAAQGFINAVKQRQHTLLTTMQTIIDIQRPFFLEGDESLLKPMILKDVAERAKLDISTISRVSNSKYVQTNYGIYSLKFFFSDGYTTEDGEELSVREIKRILKECVDNEDKEKPYTDDEPDEMSSISILRGLKERYENHHKVRIKDDAIIAAVQLSERYITDRFLPDKAIDLMDEAAAKLRIEVDSVPEALDEISRRIKQLEIEREAIKRENDTEKLQQLAKEIADLKEEETKFRAKWQSEKELVNRIQQNKIDIENLRFEADKAEREGDYGKVAEISTRNNRSRYPAFAETLCLADSHQCDADSGYGCPRTACHD